MANILIPCFLSLVLCYLLNPLVDWLETLLRNRLVSIIGLYSLGLVGLFALLTHLIPTLMAQANDLMQDFPLYTQTVQEWIATAHSVLTARIPLLTQYTTPNTIQAYIDNTTLLVLRQLPTLFLATFSTLSPLFLVPVFLFFFLYQGLEIKRTVCRFIPNAYFEITMQLYHLTSHKLGYYLRGIIIETCIVTLLSILLLFIFSVKNALLLGLIAGLLNLIPYVGPLLGILPSLILIVITKPSSALLLSVLVGFLIIQIIDNILLKPLIYSQTVDVHPLIIIVVLLGAGSIAGLWGLLLAVPAAGIFKVCLSVIKKDIAFRRKLHHIHTVHD